MNRKLEILKKELIAPIRSEKQVAYILGEIRKKLEPDELSKEKYFALSMYCDWVLHSKLDRKGAVEFLKTIDINNRDSAKKISLETFREEFLSYLSENNLPVEIVNDEWFQFRKYFLNIITSVPLVNKKAIDLEIKEFCLVVPYGEVGENSRFTYKVTLGNGEIIEMGVMLGDYDQMTKRKEDRETRKFWRHYKYKTLYKRIDSVKNLAGEEKKRFEEENEAIFRAIKKEEEDDQEEALKDMMSDLMSGGSGWL